MFTRATPHIDANAMAMPTDRWPVRAGKSDRRYPTSAAAMAGSEAQIEIQ